MATERVRVAIGWMYWAPPLSRTNVQPFDADFRRVTHVRIARLVDSWTTSGMMGSAFLSAVHALALVSDAAPERL